MNVYELIIKQARARLGEFKRQNMPQVKAKDVTDADDIPTSKLMFVNPKRLKNVQTGIDQSKVDSMAANWKEVMKVPVLISKNNYVLDGHHRVAAAIKKNKWVRVYKVQLGAHEAIQKLKELNKCQ